MKIKSRETTSQLEWADSLRALATFAVIVLHVSGVALDDFGKIPDSYWWIANVYDGISRFCVPIFVMLTGALLLGKEYELNEFLKKRMMRIIIPFVFWSVVYIIFFWFRSGSSVNEQGVPKTLQWLWLQIKNGSSYHLWYVYMIIGIFLFIPIIGKFVRHSTEKEMRYFLLLWMLTLLLHFPLFTDFKPNIELRYFSGFLGYAVLGYYLYSRAFEKFKKMVLIFLALAAAIFTIVGTYVITVHNTTFSDVFYDYQTPNVCLLAASVFLLFKSGGASGGLMLPIRNLIARYSYGIFLVHVLVLTILSDYGIKWDIFNPMIGIPLTAFICLTITLFIVVAINKLPLGKYVSG